VSNAQRPAPDLQTWREAIRLAAVAPSTKLVCHAIAHYIRPDCAGPVCVATRQIAADTRLHSSTVNGHVRRAAQAGLLARRVSHGRRIEVAATLPPEPQRVILFGDPRWAAWSVAFGRDPDADPRATLAIRLRAELIVDSDWPAPSAEVDGPSALGLVTIPWGTPEHAAWLTHHRRGGNVLLAQSADLSRRTLMERRRWPTVQHPAPTDPAVVARGRTREARP
jgi:hypothetical protein